MKRHFLVFWLFVVSFSPICGKDRADLSAILPVWETYIDQAMSAEGVPGAIVVIVKDGKVIYLKGFGVKIYGKNDPVDKHTPFAIASLTKNFTNTLIARLVDQGKLHWDDKVSKYLPDFQLGNSKISQELTIRDILSHRTGLPGFSGDTLNELGWSAPEIVKGMKKIPLEGEVGKTFTYQNILVGLMGEIIEKVTGKSLLQNYQEEIFQPAGLEETKFGDRNPPTFWQKFFRAFQRKDEQPTFHDIFQGKTRYLPQGNPALYTFPASSGLISTGEDLGKWMIFQLNMTRVNGKPTISELNLNQMRTPYVNVQIQGGRQWPQNRVTRLQYGMGWFIHDYAGVDVLSHMGGMEGTRSFLMLIPQDNMGVAIVANLGGMRVSLFPEAIRSKFLDLYLNVKEEIDWAKNLRVDHQDFMQKYNTGRREQMMQRLAPARSLNDYVGIYENELYGKVEIVNKDNNLVLIYRDLPETKLTHWNGNGFQFEGTAFASGFSGTDSGEITFSDDHGKSQRLMINLLREGEDPIFNRVH